MPKIPNGRLNSRNRSPTRKLRTSPLQSSKLKDDMHQPIVMDRLLCGDVGYGKTEIAMRAAFKAVENGKQVAILTPTTVLSVQHGRTFTERFADFPVWIEVLNRFKTTKASKGNNRTNKRRQSRYFNRNTSPPERRYWIQGPWGF